VCRVFYILQAKTKGTVCRAGSKGSKQHNAFGIFAAKKDDCCNYCFKVEATKKMPRAPFNFHGTQTIHKK
jgi:hypothetical protein